jgi:hypothetical protein
LPWRTDVLGVRHGSRSADLAREVGHGRVVHRDPGARPVGDLREDPALRLDEVELEFGERQLGEVPEQRGRQREELAEGFDPGEAAADDGHRGQLPAFGAWVQHRRVLEGREQPVPDRDRLFDVLQADALVGDSGDGEGAGDGARRDHYRVIAQFPLDPAQQPDGDGAMLVVDRRRGAGDDLRAAQVAPQRHGDVAGFHRSGRQAGVSAAHDQNPSHFESSKVFINKDPVAR